MPRKNSLTDIKSKELILTSDSDVEVPKKQASTKRIQLLITEAEYSNLEKKAGIAGVAAYLRHEIRTTTDIFK